MTLIEIIENLASFSDDETIYVGKPWGEKSTSIVTPEPEQGDLPAVAVEQNLNYFLEVFIAREFLEDWEASLDVNPGLKEKCERLIKYAINDA